MEATTDPQDCPAALSAGVAREGGGPRVTAGPPGASAPGVSRPPCDVYWTEPLAAPGMRRHVGHCGCGFTTRGYLWSADARRAVLRHQGRPE